MKGASIPTAFLVPRFWNLLSDSDKFQYNRMRAVMSQPSNKNQRNKRIETVSDSLDMIRKYAVRGDGDDWRRCLVCGVFWLPEGLAINTHQLRILIFKCKSSINGSLQKMGYTISLGRTDAATAMIAGVPFLKDNATELRQWTVRQQETGGSRYEPVSPPPENTRRAGFVMPMVNLGVVVQNEVKADAYDELALGVEEPTWGTESADIFEPFAWNY